MKASKTIKKQLSEDKGDLELYIYIPSLFTANVSVLFKKQN